MSRTKKNINEKINCAANWKNGATCECNPNGPWDCIPECPDFESNMKLIRKRVSKYVPRQPFRSVSNDYADLVEMVCVGGYRSNNPEHAAHLDRVNAEYFDKTEPIKERCEQCNHELNPDLLGSMIQKNNRIVTIDCQVYENGKCLIKYGKVCNHCVDWNPCRSCGNEMVKYRYCFDCANK